MASWTRWTISPPATFSTNVNNKEYSLFRGAMRVVRAGDNRHPGGNPVSRCIFPNAPPKEVFPVVGVTPGLIAMVQATEVLKYLTQDGRLLTNRLFLWDGREARAEEICVERNPACPVCGEKNTGKTQARKNR